MTLEEDLRETLRNQAAEPSFGAGLLDDVRVGVRRDKRRRTAVVSAAAVLVAVVAVPAVVVQRQSPPALNPTPPVSAPPVPASPSTGIAWERAGWQMPTFPLTPGWLPPGLGPRRVDQMGPNVLLMYDDDRGDVLSVEVGPEAGSWEVEGEGDHRATIGSAAATVRTTRDFDGARKGDRYVGVRWKLADGRWVQLLSFGPRTEAQVLRFARGLRAQPVPASPAPFRLAEVPRGLVVSFASTQFMCLTRPPVTQETMQQGLCLGVEPAEEPTPDGSRVTIGGRPAVFTGDSALQIGLGGKQVLSIYADSGIVDLTPDELVRFATGVEVTG
jgi:hypothetical protein